MKTALITGGEGFIGRHLKPMLVREGYEIISIDPRHQNPWTTESWLKADEATWDVVIHLAANIESLDKRWHNKMSSYRDIALDFEVCNWVAKHPPRDAFVYMSSCAVDTPGDPYAYVKTVGERFCQSLCEMAVPVVILRPFSGYGTDQNFGYPFPAILNRAMRGDKPLVVWGTGKQVRDWIHGDDIARAIIRGIMDFPRGIPIEIGTGVGTSLNDLATMIWDTARPGEKLFLENDESKPSSSLSRVANTGMAKRYGFYASISLEEGIREAVKEKQSAALARANA